MARHIPRAFSSAPNCIAPVTVFLFEKKNTRTHARKRTQPYVDGTHRQAPCSTVHRVNERRYQARWWKHSAICNAGRWQTPYRDVGNCYGRESIVGHPWTVSERGTAWRADCPIERFIDGSRRESDSSTGTTNRINFSSAHSLFFALNVND